MKLLSVISAALSSDMFYKCASAPFWKQLHIKELDSFFPALTAPAQAAFRTAGDVSYHGMGSGGYYDRLTRKTNLWEQASCLYEGKRIWEDFRAKGGKVGQICMQQCPGMDCDMYLTPAPIYKRNGGIIQNFCSSPPDLYQSICEEIKAKFNIMHYWGPSASIKASRWIAKATAEMMKRMTSEEDVYLLSYIPHLDYAPQKHGPDSTEVEDAFAEYEECMEIIFNAAQECGFELQIIGDYAITPAKTAVFPNKLLAEKDYLVLQDVDGMLYPNLHSSHAFALVDHQICHVYVNDPADIPSICAIFEAYPGVSCAISRADMPEWDHPRCGEVILIADEGAWFAYPWWEEEEQAPDFASRIDIHSKPGFDPLELFSAIWPPKSISQDTELLQGTFGRPGRIIHASTFQTPQDLRSFTGAAAMIRDMLSK